MAKARVERIMDTEREGENERGGNKCRIMDINWEAISKSKAWRSVLV